MWPFFLISSMVLGLLDQLQIFLQLCLVELLGLLTGLVLLELQHLTYLRLLTGLACWSSSLKSHGISGQIFGLIYSFSVTDGFNSFRIGSLRKNIQLMLEFLKAPFLVLHFSCYTLITFLMMLSVILLSVILLSGI